MGNTNASFGGKDATSTARQRNGGGVGTGGHHDLPLRDRFEALAKPVPNLNSTEHEANHPVAAISTSSSSASDGTCAGEKFVWFEDCSKLAGPRGAQVAARLYRVLDADGDGRLDFQEFSSAACLLKGSGEEDKRQLLFKMYSDTNKPGLVGRDGLQAFILDMIAASPPPSEPPGCTASSSYRGSSGGTRCQSELVGGNGGRREMEGGQGRKNGIEGGRAADGEEDFLENFDFEVELKDVLVRMAGVVLAECDVDGDGMLSQKEWMAYLQREEEGVGAFLNTLSDSVGKLLLE